jgi:transposase
MSLLNTSINSLASSCTSLNKENSIHVQNKDSRLEKIMKIKVQKPQVNSTLVNYEPRQGEKSTHKPARESSVSELKECKKRIKKAEQYQDK